jgi:hypothetical protein
MGNVVDALAAAGINVGAPLRPEVRSSLARLARHIRSLGVRTLGLAPADDGVAIPALALALGRSLAETAPDPVAVVDATGRWPCASALRELSDASMEVATGWIAERLAIITPTPGEPGETLSMLEAIIVAAPRFAHLVVDLTGMEQLGICARAYDLLNGTALVARAGRTSTRRMARAYRQIPGERSLGVLLTGA